MRFKHTFHVFVDNFSVTYKQLLYRLVILVVAGAIGFACVLPFIRGFLPELTDLYDGVRNFIMSLLEGNVGELKNFSERVQEKFNEILALMQTKVTDIVLMVMFIVLLYIIEKWFAGLGNYSAAVLINDKMALRANSPFIGSLIKNLKEAAIYNLIYVPLSILYDLAVCVLMFVLLYYLLNGVSMLIISIFIFALVLIIAIAFKMTFTCDWLPALICGKKGQRGSIKYTFSRKGKDTFKVFSNFIVLILLILSLNVTAVLTTFGVGILLTVPASYVILLSFEMVNYYDREELKYFIDKNTIVRPAKERTFTREQFFKGEQD